MADKASQPISSRAGWNVPAGTAGRRRGTGSEIQAPMAIVVLGGLLSSTALNMIVSGAPVPAKKLEGTALFDQVVDGNLLDNTLIIFGSPMGNSNDVGDWRYGAEHVRHGGDRHQADPVDEPLEVGEVEGAVVGDGQVAQLDAPPLDAPFARHTTSRSRQLGALFLAAADSPLNPGSARSGFDMAGNQA